MKLKYILNAILFVLALSFLSMCIFKTTELSLKCMQFAVSISCIGAMFSTKDIDTYCIYCFNHYRNIFFTLNVHNNDNDLIIEWYNNSPVYR